MHYSLLKLLVLTELYQTTAILMKSGAGLLNYKKRNLPFRQGEVVEPSSELAELTVRSGHARCKRPFEI